MPELLECELTTTEEETTLLARALRKNLEQKGFGHLKVGMLEGPGVWQYVRDSDVVAIAITTTGGGARLVVESETLNVAELVQHAIARAAYDLCHELLAGSPDGKKPLSAEQTRAELLRLIQNA